MTSCAHKRVDPVPVKKKVVPFVSPKPQVVLPQKRGVPGKKLVSPNPADLVINGIAFPYVDATLLTWATLPHPEKIVKKKITSYTNKKGDTHYYQVVRVKDGQLDWYQMASLAEDAGGYLACLTDQGENDFVFSLVKDPSYWCQVGTNEALIGPAIGGYQPNGSNEPDGNWKWLSGEKMTWTNWTQNLDDGVLDRDPRDNTQPNDSSDNFLNSQSIMAFGDLSVPVSTWGDFSPLLVQQNGTPCSFKAFIIEYPTNPSVSE